MTGALIGLARATDGNEHLISQASTAVIVEGLSATLPAFVSSNVLNFLMETFDIAPITTPEADLKVILVI